MVHLPSFSVVTDAADAQSNSQAHPRLLDRHRPCCRGHLPLGVVAVTDHQPMTVLVDLVSVRLDVAGDLGLQRRCQHPPSTVAHDLIQQRRPHRRAGRAGLAAFMDYLEHGHTFPNQRANAGPDQSYLDFQIILGKVRPFTSPHRGPSTGSDHCSA